MKLNLKKMFILLSVFFTPIVFSPGLRRTTSLPDFRKLQSLDDKTSRKFDELDTRGGRGNLEVDFGKDGVSISYSSLPIPELPPSAGSGVKLPCSSVHSVVSVEDVAVGDPNDAVIPIPAGGIMPVPVAVPMQSQPKRCKLNIKYTVCSLCWTAAITVASYFAGKSS